LAVERGAWTRGRDGWSGVGEDGSGEVRSVFFSFSFLFLSFLIFSPLPPFLNWLTDHTNLSSLPLKTAAT
jgi:hypothetical protein